MGCGKHNREAGVTIYSHVPLQPESRAQILGHSAIRGDGPTATNKQQSPPNQGTRKLRVVSQIPAA
jgi:hypothetical protein